MTSTPAKAGAATAAKKRATRKPAPKLPTAAPVNTPEETPVTEETPRRTRQADPLLAAKKALVVARKKQAKAKARVDAHGDIIAALDAANEAVIDAEAAFDEAVAAV